MISLTGPHQAQLNIAKELRRQRIESNYTQKDLATRSGVPLPTLRKFERTGIISLESFLKIAVIFGLLEKIIESVTNDTEFSTIDQMLALKKHKSKQRVRK